MGYTRQQLVYMVMAGPLAEHRAQLGITFLLVVAIILTVNALFLPWWSTIVLWESPDDDNFDGDLVSLRIYLLKSTFQDEWTEFWDTATQKEACLSAFQTSDSASCVLVGLAISTFSFLIVAGILAGASCIFTWQSSTKGFLISIICSASAALISLAFDTAFLVKVKSDINNVESTTPTLQPGAICAMTAILLLFAACIAQIVRFVLYQPTPDSPEVAYRMVKTF
jgi:hypothetical protein